MSRAIPQRFSWHGGCVALRKECHRQAILKVCYLPASYWGLMKIPPPCQGCLWWGVWQQPDFLLVLPLHKSPAWISALTESWGLPSSQKRPFFSCWQGRASAQYRSLWESLSFFWQLANDTYALVPVPISSLWLWLASCNLLTCCLKWPFSWVVCSSSSLVFSTRCCSSSGVGKLTHQHLDEESSKLTHCCASHFQRDCWLWRLPVTKWLS